MNVHASCPHCGQSIEINGLEGADLITCPTCEQVFEVRAPKPPPALIAESVIPPKPARIVKSSETNGVGILMEVLGLLFCLTIIGAIVGIPLLIAGSRMTWAFRCGACGNKVDSKKVRLCPTCRVTLA